MTETRRIVPSPVGALTLVAGAAGLVAILWEDDDPARVPLGPLAEAPHPVLDETARQLDAYFAGTLTAFSVPLDLRGTAFQRQVWAALLEIPFGRTRSYAEIARHVGRPTAYRAVGAAVGRNPVSIVVPCHRVIGAGGAMTGFAGGLPRKRHLLAVEGRETPGLALPI